LPVGNHGQDGCGTRIHESTVNSKHELTVGTNWLLPPHPQPLSPTGARGELTKFFCPCPLPSERVGGFEGAGRQAAKFRADSPAKQSRKVAQTSVFEVCGLSTMNQEKAADLHRRSALPTSGKGQVERGGNPAVMVYHQGRNAAQMPRGQRPPLTWISHHAETLWGGLPEGRGFSPAEIAVPALCSSRDPRSLQPQAARVAGHGNNQKDLVTAGLKPRPSKPVVRNPG